jgi:hypothetical protein
MTTKTRDILQLTKARISNDIIAIESTLGIVAARTVTLPLTAAFDAINRILRAEAPVNVPNLAQGACQSDSGTVGEGNHAGNVAGGL